MGLFKYLVKSWKQQLVPKVVRRDRLVVWRREKATTRLEHPSRLDRARALGYRAKLGIFVVRQRVKRGPHKRPKFGSRRTRNQGIKINLHQSYRIIAEQRASKVYVNCEVLNSYYVAEDGKHYWYEVIMVDRSHPSVVSDHRTNFISRKKGRVNRGLTSAGRKVRGLHKKGMGTEKARPSRRANKRRL